MLIFTIAKTMYSMYFGTSLPSMDCVDGEVNATLISLISDKNKIR